MRKPVTLCISLSLLLTMAVPASGIVHCHDYVYYVLTGNDWNNLSAKQLRETLTGMGYKLLTTTTPGIGNESSKLKRHDVLIFDSAHSGVVVDDLGHINHYLQSTKLVEQGKAYDTATFRSITDSNNSELLFKRGWTLKQIRDIEHKVAQLDGTTNVVTPFKDAKMEIWRHPNAESLPKTNRFW